MVTRRDELRVARAELLNTAGNLAFLSEDDRQKIDKMTKEIDSEAASVGAELKKLKPRRRRRIT